MAATKGNPASKTNVTDITVAKTTVPARASGIAGFKVVKRVTMPTLSLKENEPRVLRIDDAMRESKYIDPDPKKAKEKPATICSVTDMQTGEVAILLVPEVMKKNLDEAYTGAAYVGRVFGVQKLPKRPGKRYFDLEIAELEAEPEAA